MKKVFLLLLILLFSKVSFSQYYNFYRLSVGIGGGVNAYFGDIENQKISPSFQGMFDYNITPFSTIGLEVQRGKISAGPDKHQKAFTNNYTALILNGSIQLEQLVNIELNDFLYKIRGVYFGAGGGLIMNNQSKIVRVKTNPNGQPYTFPGVDKGTELMVISKIGWNFMERYDAWDYKRYCFFVEHQFNVTFGEGLDGYNDPPPLFNNKSPDMYGLTTVGVKYTFGPEGIY